MSNPQQESDPWFTENELPELIKGFVAENRDAAERLVDYITPILLYILRKHFGEGPIAHEIEDIVQEAWLRAFQHRHRYDASRASFVTWIGRIALNRAIERQRAQLSHDPARAVYDLPDKSEPNRRKGDDKPPTEEAPGWPPEALLRLPQEDQKMLQFYSTHPDDDWQAAYSHITGMNPSTLRSRFARALQKLDEGAGGADVGLRTWIEGVGDAFWVGDCYQLFVDLAPLVTELASRARYGAEGPPPDDLLVIVAGEDIMSEPPSQPLLADKMGSGQPLAFDLLLLRGGRSVEFLVSVYRRPDLELVREVAVVLPEVKYRITAPDTGPYPPPDTGRG